MTTEQTHQEFFADIGGYDILIYTPTSRGKITVEQLYQQFADRLRHEMQKDELEAVIREENEKAGQQRKSK